MALGSSADQDWFQATICLFQSVLLASFALILGVHRSAIMDKHSNLHNNNKQHSKHPRSHRDDEELDVGMEDEDSYCPPSATATLA